MCIRDRHSGDEEEPLDETEKSKGDYHTDAAQSPEDHPEEFVETNQSDVEEESNENEEQLQPKEVAMNSPDLDN